MVDKEEFKYGVDDLAAALGIENQSARVFLRKIGHKKAGRSYGWNTKAEIDALVKQFTTKPEAPKAEKAKVEKAAPTKITKKAAPKKEAA